MSFSLSSAKAAFFTSGKVRAAINRGKRRALSKFGAFVRTRARTSIRKRKGTSPAGSPPFSHVGLLRKGILFAYDAANESVVIGPIMLNKYTGVPELLEKGGTALRGKPPKPATYPPRPYMGPAFAAELPKAPAMLKNLIH